MMSNDPTDVLGELLTRAALHPLSCVVQWFKAAMKVHDERAVAQMLVESPRILGDYQDGGTTALHLAACHDHDLIAAHLLTEEPSLADAIDEYQWDAFRTAATHGSGKVVAVLLAKTPHVVQKTNNEGRTALHFAARDGHDGVVAQLLAAAPNLVNAVASMGWTPMHCAALNGQELIVDMLLAANPQPIYSNRGESVLKLSCMSRSRNKEFFAKLLASLPPNVSLAASFTTAVFHDNHSAIELLQPGLTFEEIVNAFMKCKKSFEERLRPIVEGQCACLVEESLLHRDVVVIVFEYLGFTCRSGNNNNNNHKRGRDEASSLHRLHKRSTKDIIETNSIPTK